MTKLRPTAALVLFCQLLACAPARPPIPAGVIPPSRAPSVNDEQYGHEILNQLQQRYRLDYNNPAIERINTVVERLTAAAHADKDPWHVYLFKDDDFKNAGATRGNHVFVWTGMLSAVRSDDELAAVLAHEISHVLAGHTEPDPNEELKRMLIGITAMAAGIAVSAATHDPFLGRNLGNLTSSVTSEVGSSFTLYPHSKEMELEADRVGLLLMAAAKYDPEAAISFWERAQNDPGFSAAIPFFSSHPPAEERLKNLRTNLALAQAKYKGNQANDSFDLNSGASASPTPSLPAPPVVFTPATDRVWKVVAEKAVLYRSPSNKSRALGEFRSGATIAGVSEKNGWLEITRPDRGFLQTKDLAPVYDLRSEGAAVKP